jgi:hypothetical protein
MSRTRTQPARPTPYVAICLAAALFTAAAAPAAPAATPSAASAASAPKPFGYDRLHKKKAPPKPVKLVDLNSASKAELKTLPYIGDAEADKIIASRPFLTKAELVSKGIIVTGPYLSLKNKVVALQKNPPKPPAKAAKP